MTWTMLGIFFLILILTIVIIVSSDFEKQKQNRAKGFIFSAQYIKYCGGFPEISAGKNVLTNIKLNKQELVIEFVGKGIVKNISIYSIKDAMCSTSEEVNRMVSLGKLIVFGALAFGMKTKKDIIKCAVITYEDEFNKERSLVFEMHPDLLVKSILDIKRNQIQELEQNKNLNI